jgi:hypothetical protein
MWHFLNRARTSARSVSSPKRTARPAIEALEDRMVPTSLSTIGGPVLPHVEAEAVYFGGTSTYSWNQPAQQQRIGQLDNFLGSITGSSYLDMLGEYGVGRGSFLGHDVATSWWQPATQTVNGTTTASIDDAFIHTMLRQEIADGRVPPPDANRLYVVYLPSGVDVTATAGAGGYHRMDFDLIKGNVYYAVIKDLPGLHLKGAPLGLDSFQTQTVATSHELAEAVTDPDTITGWRDRDQTSQTKNDEIGDIPQDLSKTPGDATGMLNGYLVQKEWSNRANASILTQSQPGWNDLGGQTLTQTVAAHTQDGHQVVFALASNGTVYVKEQEALLSTTWGLWRSLGGNARSISVATDLYGRLQLFALNRDGSVSVNVETSHDATSFWGWSSLGGYALTQMTVSANQDGRLEVFALGGDRAVYHQWQTDTSSSLYNWSGWGGLGGYVQAITVGHDHLGRLEVAALGMDRAAYLIGQVTANGGWGAWTGLGGTSLQQLQMTNQADGRLMLFALGGDHATYCRTESLSLSWGNWTYLGGYVQSIQVGHDAAYRVQVVALGFDNQIYEVGQTQRNAGFGGWVGLGGNMTSFALANNPNGDLLIYALGNDHSLYAR